MNKIKKLAHYWRWRVIRGQFKEFVKPNTKIIDIGAGDLYLSSLMEKELNCEVVGVDIKEYKTDYTDYIKRIIIKNNKLPFKDKTFDYAVFNGVLHHIPKQEHTEILNEAKRVANNLIIIEDYPTLLSKFIDIVSISNINVPTPLTHRHTKEWIELLNKLEFDVIFHLLRKPFPYPIQHLFFITK